MTFRQFVILIAFFVATIFSFADCKWCGSSSYGSGCPYSQTGKHEHCDCGDGEHCIYCNSTVYGSGCPYSPDAKHKHTSNAKKCRWCGSKSHGSGCPYSPNKKHEF